MTITLDEKTARWARVYAAKHDTSLSRLVGEMLRERMEQLRDYENAMRRFLAKPPVRLNRSGAKYSRREVLHDRAGIR